MVKNILKPASRLIVVFILTMIISGGILTYLSINSIANFRELTEKKVTEEQFYVAEHLSIKFQGYLEEITGKYSTLLINVNETDWSGIKEIEMLDFVLNPFIVDGAGDFLRPWYLEELHVGAEIGSLQAYWKNLKIAQRKEFQENDYQTAELYYNRSLEYALGSTDTVRSLNAIGRVNMKMRNFNISRSYYSRITSDYASTLDNSGFPYVYYAILNLLKLSEFNDTVHVFPEVAPFLKGMHLGTVPLNSSTSDLLARISSRKDSSLRVDSTQKLKLDDYISKIDEDLRFVNNYHDMIKTSLDKERTEENPLQLGGFMVIYDRSVDPGRIVLIDPEMEHPSGFCLDLDSIWPGFMTTSYSEQTEFDYHVSLIRIEENGNHRNEKLAIFNLLSSYFPEYEIRVGLQDEKLIDTFVKKRRWTYGIALILLLGAMFMGILLILRDISRERRLGQLRSDFVSNVTHELKTPLTSIHLFAESVLLDRVPTESGQKEYLQIILKETERLKRMINNILDFSKREKEKISYRFEEVNITELIYSALKDLNYWLVENGFTVHTELEDDVKVSADHDALKQVVINLLDNAIKYSGTQKEIRIRLVSEKHKIRIDFSDKGIGIPEDHLDTIFEKFYRVNDPMVEGVGGTGLGLTVVKEIIEAHHGEILVESTLREGSSFKVLLNSS